MEKLDRDLQRRVWQRVQSGAEEKPQQAPRENWKAWLLLLGENAAAYRAMARQAGGRRGERLHALEQQTQRCAGCIRGIFRLRREDVKELPIRPPREQSRRLLEQCYYRERRLWEEAAQREEDPEFGHVCRYLAEGAKERCTELLALLGRQE